MIAMPIARKHAAASKGETGPKPRVSARALAKSPDRIATSPFPRNMALEKVSDSHCASNPLCSHQSGPQNSKRNDQRRRMAPSSPSPDCPIQGWGSDLVVLRDEPRLKGREQERRGDPPQDAAHHQDLVLWRVLGDAAQDVGDAVGHAGPLPAPSSSTTTRPKREVSAGQ